MGNFSGAKAGIFEKHEVNQTSDVFTIYIIDNVGYTRTYRREEGRCPPAPHHCQGLV